MCVCRTALYPYGEAVGDRKLLQKHYWTIKLKLDTGFPVGDELQYTIFVSLFAGVDQCMLLTTNNSIVEMCVCYLSESSSTSSLQWGAADSEIKVPSGEKTELKPSLFQDWCR